MSNLLYKQESPGGYGGAQRLTPGTEGGLINVLEDYPWTLSPKNVKKYIPYIELEEFRQNFSSEIIGLVRNLAGNAQNLVLTGGVGTTAGLISDLLIGKTVTGVAAGAGERALTALERIGAALATAPVGTPFSRVGGGVLAAGAGTARSLLSTGVAAGRALTTQTAAYNLAKDSLTNINQNITPDMDPYANLYSATPTGFRYKLPYLSIDNFMKAGGQWSPANEKGPVGQSLQSLQTLFTRNAGKGDAGATNEQRGYDVLEALDKVAKGLVGAAPGVAAEALKSFAPSAEGETVKLTFYLSNTIGSNIKIIQKNWEFLYLLTYQNLPNRRSINLLDPPCLYRVRIPGVKTYPVAIIESLEVTNEGTTRKINLETGEISKEDGPGIKTVPEVYKVSLTIKSLLTTTQNIFAYSQANEEKVNVITSQFSATDTIFKATKGRFTKVEDAANFLAPSRPVPFQD